MLSMAAGAGHVAWWMAHTTSSRRGKAGTAWPEHIHRWQLGLGHQIFKGAVVVCLCLIAHMDRYVEQVLQRRHSVLHSLLRGLFGFHTYLTGFHCTVVCVSDCDSTATITLMTFMCPHLHIFTGHPPNRNPNLSH